MQQPASPTNWPARFAAFAARKEAEARAAAIAPLVTDIDTGGAGLRTIGNEWSRSLFDGPFYVSGPRDERPATSLVFVQSRDGNTVAKNPSTLGGGEADKHLIYEGLSRAAADAVLSGARTIHGGDVVLSTWHPEMVRLRASLNLPRHPVQIVATIRGMPLERELMFNVPELRVLLLTVPDAVERMRRSLEARPWVTPLPLRSPADLRPAFRELWRLGVRTMSCIGGPTLARQLIDAGLIDDVYLTTSAKKGGEPNTPLYPGPLDGRTIVAKHGTRVDAGVVFQHSIL